MTDSCSQHAQLTEWINKLIETIGKHDAHISTSLANQEKLLSVAEANQRNIDKLKAIVENGLTDRTKNIEVAVQKLKESMEQFERERAMRKAIKDTGIAGFLSKGWEDFKSRFAWVVIVTILWIIAWGLMKAFIFREYPFPIPPIR